MPVESPQAGVACHSVQRPGSASRSSGARRPPQRPLRAAAASGSGWSPPPGQQASPPAQVHTRARSTAGSGFRVASGLSVYLTLQRMLRPNHRAPLLRCVSCAASLDSRAGYSPHQYHRRVLDATTSQLKGSGCIIGGLNPETLRPSNLGRSKVYGRRPRGSISFKP